jgi:hypothetical protein
MEVVRLISLYDKKTEELIREYNIDFIGIDALRKIFSPPEDDPLMYNFYWIEENEVGQMKEFIDLDFDLEKYIYQVECFQAGT